MGRSSRFKSKFVVNMAGAELFGDAAGEPPPPATPPTVDAGGPYSGDVSTAIALNGTVTPGTDPNPAIQWSILSGGTGTFADPNAVDTTFTPDNGGEYVLRLSANPFDGAAVTDTANLTSVATVTPPTVDAGGPYSGTVSTAIQLDGTVTPGSDPTPAVKWSIVSGGTGTFGDISVVDTTFTPDAEGSYVLRLEAGPIDGLPVTDDANLTSQPVAGVDPIFSVALQASLTPEIATGSPTPTFTRGSIATFTDYKGQVREVPVDSPRFLGARYDGSNFYTTRDDGTTPIDASDFYADAQGPYGYVSEGTTTNIVKWSEDFTTFWTFTRAALDTNAAVAPNGTTTAERVKDNSAGGSNSVILAQGGINVLSGDTCYSAYLKADGLNFAVMQAANFDTDSYAWFDLQNGVVGTVVGAANTGIEALADGWYRCWIVFTTTTSLSGDIYIAPAQADNNAQVPLNGTSSIFAWGVQVEQSSFPSTYIKTEADSVSRQPDVLTYDYVNNLDYNQGTLFAQPHVFWGVAPNNLSFVEVDANWRLWASLNDVSNTIRASAWGAPLRTDLINPADMALAPQQARMSWGNNLELTLGTTTEGPTPMTVGAHPTRPLGIGCRGNNLTQQNDGTIRNVTIYDQEDFTP